MPAPDRSAPDRSAPSGVDSVTVAAADAGMRLDRWLRRLRPGLGQGPLEKLVRTGQVRIDGNRCKASQRLAVGDIVRIPPIPAPAGGDGRLAAPSVRPAAAVSAADVEAMRAAVLHRDRAVLVINKPPGLAVQGGTGTVRHVDAMLEALQFGFAERPRLVHRLDRDTSGLLVLARTAAAARVLGRSFQGRTTRKLYWAVTAGAPPLAEGRIDLAIGKDGAGPGGRFEKMRPGAADAKRAVTLYRVIEPAFRKAAWLGLLPLTGRTHQLRAHCVAMGAPILGDGKYAGRDAFLEGTVGVRRLHLHARALALPHPDGGVLTLQAPLPPHMAETFDFFGFDASMPAAGLDAFLSDE